VIFILWRRISEVTKRRVHASKKRCPFSCEVSAHALSQRFEPVKVKGLRGLGPIKLAYGPCCRKSAPLAVSATVSQYASSVLVTGSATRHRIRHRFLL